MAEMRTVTDLVREFTAAFGMSPHMAGIVDDVGWTTWMSMGFARIPDGHPLSEPVRERRMTLWDLNRAFIVASGDGLRYMDWPWIGFDMSRIPPGRDPSVQAEAQNLARQVAGLGIRRAPRPGVWKEVKAPVAEQGVSRFRYLDIQ